LIVEAVKQALHHALVAFALNPLSDVHGIPHWMRVWANAQRLAALVPGVDERSDNMVVLAWFAFLHDCKRVNDDADPRHGIRAAEYAKRLWEQNVIKLDIDRMWMLRIALMHHSSGFVANDEAVILTCWDADRLDLPRVGVQPDPARMCTKEGTRLAMTLRTSSKRKETD
jgi:uncharacterized protein